MLRGRHLLSINDLSERDIRDIFEKTRFFKKRPYGNHLKNKNIVMLFAKPSTRTRVSFEVGINQLGGDDIYLEFHEAQISRGETLADTARVLSRYCDGIVARLFAHSDILDMAKYSSVPVINGLTDLLHPCQGLTDIFTILEKKKKLKGLKLAFVGDGNNNIPHSLLQACSKVGVDIALGCPKGYWPNRIVLKESEKNAKRSGSEIRIFENPFEAVKNADIVYTDTWISMGEEKEAKKRMQVFRKYQLNKKLLSFAKKNAIVMHDLPAHRGLEITSNVMDGRQSVIFDQAENRLHVEKALLSLIFGK